MLRFAEPNDKLVRSLLQWGAHTLEKQNNLSLEEDAKYVDMPTDTGARTGPEGRAAGRSPI